MTTTWCLLLLGLAIFLSGAALATVLWWCAMPGRLVRRWLAPLQDVVEIGFAEQALQARERSQRDKMWARKQQGQWCENEELRLARHEARLLAEMKRLLRPPGTTAAPSSPSGKAGRTDKQFEPSIGAL